MFGTKTFLALIDIGLIKVNILSLFEAIDIVLSPGQNENW
jgi:hypothetical protein